jgi:hypothetical protein
MARILCIRERFGGSLVGGLSDCDNSLPIGDTEQNERRPLVELMGASSHHRHCNQCRGNEDR